MLNRTSGSTTQPLTAIDTQPHATAEWLGQLLDRPAKSVAQSLRTGGASAIDLPDGTRVFGLDSAAGRRVLNGHAHLADAERWTTVHHVAHALGVPLPEAYDRVEAVSSKIKMVGLTNSLGALLLDRGDLAMAGIDVPVAVAPENKVKQIARAVSEETGELALPLMAKMEAQASSISPLLRRGGAGTFGLLAGAAAVIAVDMSVEDPRIRIAADVGAAALVGVGGSLLLRNRAGAAQSFQRMASLSAGLTAGAGAVIAVTEIA